MAIGDLIPSTKLVMVTCLAFLLQNNVCILLNDCLFDRTGLATDRWLQIWRGL